VQRAGPATGVPTKTEQGDLWQALGAGQGDYPRLIVAPTSQLDLFQTIPELFKPLRQIPVSRSGSRRSAHLRRNVEH
jgi:pyruvate/2-oxoacid:ferredoxin oxidoreductase alpha subunit